MAVDVIMPKLGESITEGTILEWKKSVGDMIDKDETLLEISTDKVDSEVPCPAAGKVLEILYKVNDVVAVGEVIARVGGEGETPSQSTPGDVKEEVAEESNDVEIKEEAEATVNIESTVVKKESHNTTRF
jgi:pyruvate dehydrogenase E2 component (dihydrolipoamide acetyltransferase)